ncbi:serine hydrolase [Ningiella sp. W23]|uniref:serine hydrolase n=1 Tax=Ningiella sp. W23 TaxID=3023715 RepID=UPI00375751AE
MTRLARQINEHFTRARPLLAAKNSLSRNGLEKCCSVWCAASLSKPVFAWIVFALTEKGVIDIDKSLHEAGFKYARISNASYFEKLTPKLILMHRSGLPNWAGDPRDHDRTDNIEFIHTPGSFHSYSGEAYLLLQKFIELKTDMSLQSLFEIHLKDEMPNSAFKLPKVTQRAFSKGKRSF